MCLLKNYEARLQQIREDAHNSRSPVLKAYRNQTLIKTASAILTNLFELPVLYNITCAHLA